MPASKHFGIDLYSVSPYGCNLTIPINSEIIGLVNHIQTYKSFTSSVNQYGHYNNDSIEQVHTTLQPNIVVKTFGDVSSKFKTIRIIVLKTHELTSNEKYNISDPELLVYVGSIESGSTDNTELLHVFIENSSGVKVSLSLTEQNKTRLSFID